MLRKACLLKYNSYYMKLLFCIISHYTPTVEFVNKSTFYFSINIGKKFFYIQTFYRKTNINLNIFIYNLIKNVVKWKALFELIALLRRNKIVSV